MLKKRDKVLSFLGKVKNTTVGNYPKLTKTILLHLLLIAFWSILFLQIELKLDSVSLTAILSSLQNITAAVFALSAVWMAIGYPEAIKAYVNPQKFSLAKGAQNTIRIEQLVNIILPATFVLSFTFLTQWIDIFVSSALPLVVKTPYYLSIKHALIFYLSILIIKTLWTVMAVNIEMANDLHDKKEESELNDRLSK